jgi:hypothetical protein
MSVNSKMTAVADQIRGLLGLTGAMGLDAMAANLETEKTNITNALTALAEKGVTVPAGANSGNLAGLIAAIEAGGGLVASGSFTVNDYISEVDVQHNLGVIPNLFLVVSNDVVYSSSYYVIKGIAAYVYIPEVATSCVTSLQYFDKSGGISWVAPNTVSTLITDTAILTAAAKRKAPYVFGVNTQKCTLSGYYSSSSSDRKFSPGATYTWVVGKV